MYIHIKKNKIKIKYDHDKNQTTIISQKKKKLFHNNMAYSSIYIEVVLKTPTQLNTKALTRRRKTLTRIHS